MKRIFLILALACLASTCPQQPLAFAAEQQTLPTVTVVMATGVGTDASKALKKALMNAVEQAVGLIVDAETVVKNEKVIKDEILTYSDGFVEKFEKLKEAKDDDGLWEVKVKAVVRKLQLIEKLKASKVSLIQVDGQSLFGQVVTQVEGGKNAAKLLEKAFEGLPLNLLSAEILNPQPKIIKKSDAEITAGWTVLLAYNHKAYYDKVVPALQKALESVALRKSSQPLSGQATYDTKYDLHTPLKKSPFFTPAAIAIPSAKLADEHEAMILLNVGRNTKGDNLRWLWYVVDKAAIAVLAGDICKRAPKMRVSFLDNGNNVIREDDKDITDDNGAAFTSLSREANKNLLEFPSKEFDLPGFATASCFVDYVGVGRQRMRLSAHEDSGGVSIRFLQSAGHRNAISTLDKHLKSEASFSLKLSPFLRMRSGGAAAAYGDLLEIPIQATFSLEEVKRISSIRCSFVE